MKLIGTIMLQMCRSVYVDETIVYDNSCAGFITETISLY